jgi:hypothetical protein
MKQAREKLRRKNRERKRVFIIGQNLRPVYIIQNTEFRNKFYGDIAYLTNFEPAMIVKKPGHS